METFRHGVTSLAQLVTVFVLADITLIGFAIDNQIAGIIFLGALFPLFIMNSASVVGKLLTPTIFTAYCIEQKCGAEISGLMHTGLRVNFSREVAHKLAAISAISNIDDQAAQLRRLNISMFGRRKAKFFDERLAKSAGGFVSTFISCGQIAGAIFNHFS